MAGTKDGELMSGAEIVLRALADQKIEHVFGYPGGAVLPIYDEFFQQDKVKHILVRHEQGATHMAEGYARSTGKVGVALATSGPGATNCASVRPVTQLVAPGPEVANATPHRPVERA